ncbi:hypothetical protein MMC11_002908 [Xylographa trunciseda]|nr:hypothetical protein [Xylographa trunciseda]
MSTERPLQITFGVEIECVLRMTEEQYNENEAKFKEPLHNYSFSFSNSSYASVFEILSTAGIPVNNGLQDPSDTHWDERWTIKEDSSIDAFESEGDNLPGHEYKILELVSRILPLSYESYEEIENVLQTIQTKYTLITNESTGLHVHVGDGNRGFTLQTLKRFSVLAVAFEDVIESIHPDTRISVDGTQQCKKSSWGTQDILEISSTIEECLTFEELRLLMNPELTKKYAYNFGNLSLTQHLPKMTIEFRQHEGTVDPERIIYWVKFVTGLVNYSHTVTSAQHAWLWMSYSRDQQYTVLDLMKAISKGELTSHYESRLHLRESPNTPVPLSPPPMPLECVIVDSTVFSPKIDRPSLDYILTSSLDATDNNPERLDVSSSLQAKDGVEHDDWNVVEPLISEKISSVTVGATHPPQVGLDTEYDAWL